MAVTKGHDTPHNVRDILRQGLQTIALELKAANESSMRVESKVDSLGVSVKELGGRVGNLESIRTAENLDRDLQERLRADTPSAFKRLFSYLVLVSEDHESLASALTRTLHYHGAEVIRATGQAQAREVMRGRSKLDGAVLDYYLPNNERGIDLAVWVRSQWPACRLVLTSGDMNGLDAQRELIAAIGAITLEKPWDAEEIVRLLEKEPG